MRLISVSTDRSVPMDFKVSFPQGCFRNISRFIFKEMRPSFVDRQLHAPSWWKSKEVIAVFDKVMTDRVSRSRLRHKCCTRDMADGQHKKPTFLQRLTRSGVGRMQAQLSVGEQVAKVMMRRRARE